MLDPNSDLETRRALRRENRRRGNDKLPQLDTSVKSPCISVCTMENDVCVGCNRSIDEIRDWMIMTAEEKRSVLAMVQARA